LLTFHRYALDKYVYALLGRTHLNLDEDDEDELLGTPDERRNWIDSCKNRFLTPMEIFGIKAIVMYIHALPVSKKVSCLKFIA
jgi:F-box and leucine-rich repeat protein 10/11